jgi:hypothetical protein
MLDEVALAYGGLDSICRHRRNIFVPQRIRADIFPDDKWSAHL